MRKSNLLYKSSKKFRDLMDAVHDSIEEEIAYEKENNPVAAASAGLTTWIYLKKLMTVLKVNNVCDLEYETAYDLLYWATSLSDNLHNASRKDESFFNKKFLFCKEYVELHENFLDKNMRNLGNIRREFAECYVNTGDFETCDTLFTKWLAKEPDWGWGWIGWSDCYWFFSKNSTPNLEKAIDILEQGLAIDKLNDKNHMIDRLNTLKNKLRDGI